METEAQKAVRVPLRLSLGAACSSIYTMTYTKACHDLTPASQNLLENTWRGSAPVYEVWSTWCYESVLRVPSTTYLLCWKETSPLTSKMGLRMFSRLGKGKHCHGRKVH